MLLISDGSVGNCNGIFGAYLVRVTEPRGALLLAANQCYPIIAATAEAFPNIGVAIHPSGLMRLLERAARGGTDAVGEAFVVPEGRVLEHQPAPGLADTTPPFTLVAMATDPSGCVEVTFEPELLLVRNQVRVLGVHILRGRRDLLLVERGVQIRWVREVSVVAVERVGVSVALEHPEQTMRKQRGRVLKDVRIRVEMLRRQLGWQLRGKKHAVAVGRRRPMRHQERMLLYGLEVAKVQRQRRVRNGGRRMP